MPRPELVVLAGPAPGAEAVITRIRCLDPDAAVLHHDLRGPPVHRRSRRGADDTVTPVHLTHRCLSCLLREDLLPQLLALAAEGGPRRIVLHLDPVLEPERVCWALHHVLIGGAPVTDHVDLRGLVAVVDARHWLADATGVEPLPRHGLAGRPAAEPTVAQVAVGQVELADLIVHTGLLDARTDAVLARLAPTARRAWTADLDRRVFLGDLPPGARRGRPADVHDPLLHGQPPLGGTDGVRLSLFSARRPFHPERLHTALDVLLDGVIRTRGRIWLASRPEAVLWLESAGGGLRVADAGEWLAGAGERAWTAAPAQRRALAALGWHARFGDRAQDVAVLVHDADPDQIDARLREALLTDRELAAGEAAWRTLPDPFGRWHADPCGPATGVRDRGGPYPAAGGAEPGAT